VSRYQWTTPSAYRRVYGGLQMWPKRQVTRAYKTLRGLFGKRRSKRRPGATRGRRIVKKRKASRARSARTRTKKRMSFKARVVHAAAAVDRVTGNGSVALLTGENQQNACHFPMCAWIPGIAGSTPGTALKDIITVVQGSAPGQNIRTFVRSQTMKFKIVNMCNTSATLDCYRLRWKKDQIQGSIEIDPFVLWNLTLQDLGMGVNQHVRPFLPLPPRGDTRWGSHVSTKKMKRWVLDPGQVVQFSHTVSLQKFISQTQFAIGAGAPPAAYLRGMTQTLFFVLNGQPVGDVASTASNPCYGQAKVGFLISTKTDIQRIDDTATTHRILDGSGGWAIPTPVIANERCVVDESGTVAATVIV